jgi:hypothetical protein
MMPPLAVSASLPPPLARSALDVVRNGVVDRAEDRREAMVGRMQAGLESDFLQSRQTREVTTATWRVGVVAAAAAARVVGGMTEAVGVPEPPVPPASDRGGVGGRDEAVEVEPDEAAADAAVGGRPSAPKWLAAAV